MKTMYQTSNYGEIITPVEVEKESENCVWIKGRRVNKITQYSGVFDTPELAKKFLIDTIDKEIQDAENIVKYREERKADLLIKISKCGY